MIGLEAVFKISPRQLARRASLGIAISAVPAFGLLTATDAEAEPIKVTNVHSNGNGSLADAVRRSDRTKKRDKIIFSSRLSGHIRLKRNLRIKRPVKIDGKDAKHLTIVGRKHGSGIDFKFGRTDRSSRLANLHLKRVRVGAFAVQPSTPELEVFNSKITGKHSVGSDKHAGIDAYSVDLDIRGSRIDGFLDAGVSSSQYTSVRIADSTISHNRGQGVSLSQLAGMTMKRSTVLGNRGVGISTFYYSDAQLKNSTISGNGKRSGNLGGAVNANYESGFELISTTVDGDNHSTPAYGMLGTSENSLVRFHNSIIDGKACGPKTRSRSEDGGNVLRDSSDCQKILPTDVTANPRLGKLRRRAGAPPSRKPRRRSPAIGAATKPVVGKDQRGHRRSGKHSDSGSVER